MDPVRDPGEQLPSDVDEDGKKIDPFDPNAPQIRVTYLILMYELFKKKTTILYQKIDLFYPNTPQIRVTSVI
jgi:hypothetical protein